MFSIVNLSTLVSHDDAYWMTRAVAKQVRDHACPAYGLSTVKVVLRASEADAPASDYVIALLDDPDQQGALGWHTEDAGDHVYGKVFARPVLDHGGDALTQPLSVASVLSHEVLETLADPHANSWADCGNGTLVAYEACDPVESDSYPVTLYSRSITVSNFVTPHWFDPNAAPGERLDYLGNLTRPFQMSPGGYVITMQGGQVTQHFGEAMPEWRKSMKVRPNGALRPKG